MGLCASLCSSPVEDSSPISPSTMSPNTAVPSLTKRSGGLLEVPKGRCRLAGFVLGVELSSGTEQVSEIVAKDGYLKRSGDELYLKVFVSSHKWVMTLGPAGLDAREGVTQVWTRLEPRLDEEQELGEAAEDAVFEGMSESCQLREMEDGVKLVEGLVIYAKCLGAPARIEVSISWKSAGEEEVTARDYAKEQEEEESPLERTIRGSIHINKEILQQA